MSASHGPTPPVVAGGVRFTSEEVLQGFAHSPPSSDSFQGTRVPAWWESDPALVAYSDALRSGGHTSEFSIVADASRRCRDHDDLTNARFRVAALLALHPVLSARLPAALAWYHHALVAERRAQFRLVSCAAPALDVDAEFALFLPRGKA